MDSVCRLCIAKFHIVWRWVLSPRVFRVRSFGGDCVQHRLTRIPPRPHQSQLEIQRLRHPGHLKHPARTDLNTLRTRQSLSGLFAQPPIARKPLSCGSDKLHQQKTSFELHNIPNTLLVVQNRIRIDKPLFVSHSDCTAGNN